MTTTTRDDDHGRAPGMQLDLFSPSADPAQLLDLLLVLTSTRAARPPCGCTCGFVQKAGHAGQRVGLYCSAHGYWICWLDAAGQARACRANETKERESSEVIHGHQ